MKKVQVPCRAKEVAGNIDKKVGKAIGKDKMEVEGAVKEVKGRVQKTVGDAVDKI